MEGKRVKFKGKIKSRFVCIHNKNIVELKGSCKFICRTNNDQYDIY